MNRLYLDNAATTAVRSEVLDVMIPVLRDVFGNPSSVHSFGREARSLLDQSRESIANAINAKPEEIYFTAGGSEADNWAIKGVVHANKKKGNHIITSKIEHHAVLHVCEFLQKEGITVTYLDVDDKGKVSIDDLRNAITDETILISIMYANNEIGTIQDVKAIGELARSKGILFHTDAVQALGSVEIDVVEQNVDLMSFSAHKLGGPKGVGALYIKKGTRITPLIHGGAQERSKRAGTENLPGIVGFAKALELSIAEMKDTNLKFIELRDYLRDKVLADIPHSIVNGHDVDRLPNNMSFCFRYIEGEALLLGLDMYGIGGSSGSACTSGSLDPSHVLLAIGLSHEIAHGSLRITVGKSTSKEDIDGMVRVLAKVVDNLRKMSPLYEEVIEGSN